MTKDALPNAQHQDTPFPDPKVNGSQGVAGGRIRDGSIGYYEAMKPGEGWLETD